MNVVWGLPAALWGLGLAVAPVLVHMLSRRAGRVVAVPSLRLLIRRATPSVSVWKPRDPVLLLVRTAAVVAAVLGVAAPLVVTPGRLAQWNAREVRAVVVEPGLNEASREVDAALTHARDGALAAELFVEESLVGSLAAAAAWLHNSPPARQRVVLVTSGRQGRIVPEDVASLPSGVGVEIVLAGRELPDDRRMVRRAGGRWFPLDRPAVQVVVAGDARHAEVPAPTAAGAPLMFLVELSQRDRAERIVDIAFRTPMVPADRTVPIVVRFLQEEDVAHPPRVEPSHNPVVPADAAGEAAADATSAAWWRWLRRVLKDPELQQVASVSPVEADASSTIVLYDEAGTPCVTARAESAGGLTMLERCDDVLAATFLRAAARTSDATDPRPAGARWGETVVRGWEREPAPVEAATIRATSRLNDARWCWAVCLGLLFLEQWLRRRHNAQPKQGAAARTAQEAAA